jgi:hypothetical protein
MKFKNYLNNVYFPEHDTETGIDPLKRKIFDRYKGYANESIAYSGIFGWTRLSGRTLSGS